MSERVKPDVIKEALINSKQHSKINHLLTKKPPINITNEG